MDDEPSLPTTKPLTALRYALLVTCLALAYLLLARGALSFTLVENSAVIWPSSGLALAALLRFGIRLWPGVFAGAFATGLTSSDPIGTSALIALGNTLEPVIGTWLLERFGFRLSLRRLRDYLLILIFGALVSTLFSAALGPWALVRAGMIEMQALPASILRWWMADTLGVVLAPPVLLLMMTPGTHWRSFSMGRIIEAATLLGLTFTAGLAIFCGWWQESLGAYAKAYYFFPLMVLGALRFGRQGAAVVGLLAFGQTLWGGGHLAGYFGAFHDLAFLDPWLYHLALNLTGMSLAMVLHERKEAEDALKKERSRLHASEARERSRNRVLEQLASAAPVNEVLATLVRGMEEQRPGLLGSILLLDESGQSLLIGAAPNLPEELNTSAHGLKIGPGVGACGNAAFSGERTVIENIQTHPYMAPYRALFRRFGLASCWSEPIRSASDGKILGTFAFYRRSPGLPDENDFAAIEYAAQLAGLAIERMRARDELHLAQMVYQSASEAIMVTDRNYRILAVNPAFTELTGYEPHEVLGKDPKILSSGRTPKSVYQSMWHALVRQGTWQGELWNRRKNGQLFAEWLRIRVLRDEHGEVQRYIALFTDITQRKLAEEQIWHQANYDSLTDLPNRSLFRDRLQQEIKKTQRDGTKLALLLVDLDYFKEVNDSLGHDMGDRLLIDAARRIGACIRETDLLARLGGDEFTVVLPHLNGDARPEHAAQTIVHSLAQPFQLGQETAFVTASIGIAIYPDDGGDIDMLLKNADQAMYEAKKRRRNGYFFFTPRMAEAARIRQRLIHDVREAMETRPFELHYQPIVTLNDLHIEKSEVLLRWRHPQLGMIEPSQFIPLTEEIGLIKPLGGWLFKEAALKAKRWLDRKTRFEHICVNLSPRQFHSGNDFESWLDHLGTIGLSAPSIIFEIKESLLLDERPEVADKLRSLRNVGFRLMVEDFGTGYSCLSRIGKFDIDYVKIDRTFVRDLGHDHHAQTLTEAIIAMAHKLGVQVIAEGVETEWQRDILLKAGCDYGQGEFFSSPLPESEFEQVLIRGLDKTLTTEHSPMTIP